MLATMRARMPLRSTGIASLARASTSTNVQRTFHSSRVIKDGHASAHSSEEHEEYPTETFGAPIWRWTFISVIAAAGIYRFTSTHSTHASAPASDEDLDEEEEAKKPFLTRYITYHLTLPSIWKERQDAHLDAVRQKAEDKLFFQEAERPPVRRLRFPGTFEAASPDRLPVGEAVDVSDVKVKRDS